MTRRSLTEMGFSAEPANLTMVAQKLGISVSTVSRALRNVKGVNSVTRDRVMAAAKELGYGKDSLGSGTHRTILVLAQASGVDRVQDYLTGMSRATMGNNCSLMTHLLPLNQCANMLEPQHYPSALRLGHVDGLIFVSRWPYEVVRTLSQMVPSVSLVHQYRELSLDRVGIDYEVGVLALVRHLHDLGHRTIGFYGLCTDVSWSRASYGAYIQAMATLGLERSGQAAISVTREEALAESFIDATKHAKAALRKKSVTAWISSGDLLAHSLIRSLTDLGAKVPTGISVTGFHEQEFFPSNLELTTVRLNSSALGEAAMRRILYRTEHRDEISRSMLLHSQLHVGRSTAAPNH